MSHRKKPCRKRCPRHTSPPIPRPESQTKTPHLELVVKAATSGSLEAVCEAIQSTDAPGVEVSIIHRGIGAVNKTDLLNATTGSRLILGFEVDVQPHIEELCREQNVEIRLYDIIYRLLEDLEKIATSLTLAGHTETVTGSGKVIALFKSTRHGIILGCGVEQGRLQVADRFRVISAMGPVYIGRIESLHIEDKAVKQATPGQQVGIKISGFDHAHIGDLVEAFREEKPSHPTWQSHGAIIKP